MSRLQESHRFVTGSRRLDVLLFCTCVGLLVAATSHGLRVYFRVTVAEVRVFHVSPTGGRELRTTPAPFRPVRSVHMKRPPDQAVRWLEGRIRAYVAAHPNLLPAETGARTEWVIRYAKNSSQLDRERVLVFRANER